MLKTCRRQPWRGHRFSNFFLCFHFQMSHIIRCKLIQWSYFSPQMHHKQNKNLNPKGKKETKFNNPVTCFIILHCTYIDCDVCTYFLPHQDVSSTRTEPEFCSRLQHQCLQQSLAPLLNAEWLFLYRLQEGCPHEKHFYIFCKTALDCLVFSSIPYK